MRGRGSPEAGVYGVGGLCVGCVARVCGGCLCF